MSECWSSDDQQKRSSLKEAGARPPLKLIDKDLQSGPRQSGTDAYTPYTTFSAARVVGEAGNFFC
jgi:hypothetical protein